MSDQPPAKTATMTDVKNRIGKVFKMVDRHGQVMITSYHKPLYLITRLDGDEVPEVSMEQPDKIQLHLHQPVRTALAQNTANSASNAIVGILAGLSDSELWSRASTSEQAWHKTAQEQLI